MKNTFAIVAFGLLSGALAQSETLAPSPTESVGCEPHGDHWHCKGARETAAATETATDEEESLAPSPTESVGCEPHGDHWHCDGPRATTLTITSSAASAATTTSNGDKHDHDDEGHEDHTGTESLAPSPTESVGCEPHGDHWHCDGPATGAGASATGDSTAGGASSVSTAAAATAYGAALAPVAGLAAALLAL